ncbi:hypothetical protein [Streptomyces sp. NPDC048196]|uniref:hypothetical protein n=1 Tax=Streptomyces sp. NPDC048196 TaxID=3154712 RepID=UPI0033D8C84D
MPHTQHVSTAADTMTVTATATATTPATAPATTTGYASPQLVEVGGYTELRLGYSGYHWDGRLDRFLRVLTNGSPTGPGPPPPVGLCPTVRRPRPPLP